MAEEEGKIEPTFDKYEKFPRPTGYLDDEEQPKIEEAKVSKDVLERLVYKMRLTITVETHGQRLLMFITDRPKFGRVEKKLREDRSRFYTESVMAIGLLNYIVQSMRVPPEISYQFGQAEYWRNLAIDFLATLLMNLHQQGLHIRSHKRDQTIDGFWLRKMRVFFYKGSKLDPAFSLPHPTRTDIASFSGKTVALGEGPPTQLKIFGEAEFTWPINEPFFKTKLPHFGKGKQQYPVEYKLLLEFCQKLDGKIQLQSIAGDLMNDREEYTGTRGLIFILSISAWDWLLNARFNFTREQKDPNFVVGELEQKLPSLLLATTLNRLKVPKNVVLLCLDANQEVRSDAVVKVANAAKLMRRWEFLKEGEPSWTYPEFEAELAAYWKKNNDHITGFHYDRPDTADEQKKKPSVVPQEKKTSAVPQEKKPSVVPQETKTSAVPQEKKPSVGPQKKNGPKQVQEESDDDDDPSWNPRLAGGLDKSASNAEATNRTPAKRPRKCAMAKRQSLNEDEEEDENLENQTEEDKKPVGDLLTFEADDSKKTLVICLTQADIESVAARSNLRKFFSTLLRDHGLTMEIKESFDGLDLSGSVEASIVNDHRKLITVSFKRKSQNPVDLVTEVLAKFVLAFWERNVISELGTLLTKENQSFDSVRTSVDVFIRKEKDKKMAGGKGTEENKA